MAWRGFEPVAFTGAVNIRVHFRNEGPDTFAFGVERDDLFIAAAGKQESVFGPPADLPDFAVGFHLSNDFA